MRIACYLCTGGNQALLADMCNDLMCTFSMNYSQTCQPTFVSDHGQGRLQDFGGPGHLQEMRPLTIATCGGYSVKHNYVITKGHKQCLYLAPAKHNSL